MRVVLGFVLAVASACAASSFSLDQVLSAPFPSELVSDGTGHIAWVQNAQGKRNIWVAEAPSFQGRQLTQYNADDGQEISELAISRDGSALVFTRGEGHNGKGESPNPAHLVEGVDQTVVALSFAGGMPKELGKGHGPAISPDGKTVAFVADGQIWTATSDGHAPATQLVHAHGSAESIEWSPDGKDLVFTSSRSNHAFVAVYLLGTKSLCFLDPSTDTDSNPHWSPDGKQVAFIRQQVDLDELEFGPHRSDQEPWSIRVADPFSGKGHQIWKAQPGPGSRFREISGTKQIFWGSDDRIVFPWERSGWTHLYSVSASKTESALELTPGSFEVEHVALTASGDDVVYSSNQSNSDGRQIWLVKVAGGKPMRVANEEGLEWRPVPVGNDVAFLHSGAKQPARAAVAIRGSVRELAPGSIPASFPEKGLVNPESVVFPAADGLELHGQLFVPHDSKERHPAVVFFHGGSRRQMLLGWHYMFYYNQAYGFNQYLASKGYVVLSVNYRSGIGYGLDFREALHYGAAGASEFNDVLGAGLYLRGRKDVVPNKIGLWGGSYGGFLTALGLARASDLFAVGVDLHGVHEWNEEMSGDVPPYEPEKHLAMVRLAHQSSPMAYVSTWKSPVLLIHGDDDRNVNFKQSVMLAQALRQQGVPFEELIFPDEIHDFLRYQDWLAAYEAADRFLDKYLTQ